MPFLNDLLGVQDVTVNGDGPHIARASLNIVSSGASVVDNPTAGRTDLILPGTGGDAASADGLSTTGAPVNVSAGDPPNPGDVLTAIDATHAAFTTPATVVGLPALVNDSVIVALTGDGGLAATALPMPASTILARLASGDIVAATPSQIATLLGVLSAIDATARSAAAAAQTTANAAVPATLYDANTILIATVDNTPLALTVPASTLIGRGASGGIVALNAAGIAAITGGASGGSKSLNTVPSSPHADDEEYDVASTATWILRGTASDHVTVQTLAVTSGGVDPYTAQSANSAHVDYGTRRASWMQFQTQYTNGGGGSGYRLLCKKPSVAIGTNCFLWARLGDMGRPISQDSDSLWGVAFAQEITSGPDPLNYVWCGLASTGTGTSRALFGQKCVAGTLTTFPVSVGSSDSPGNPAYEYYGLHKIGTTIHFWAWNDSMDRSHLGSTTFSGALAWQGYLAAGGQNTDPGSTVHCSDFLRRLDVAAFPF